MSRAETGLAGVPDVIAGRYRLGQRIAGGGMGEVWEGLDERLGREVAVKMLRREYVEDPEFLERFRAEARHTAALTHPGIAQVYDYGETDPPQRMAYLVMELVRGEPLSAVIARTAPMPPRAVADIIGQTALALQAAHERGVIHRDVKPANLLLAPDGRVKVTDFGIARAVDAVPLTRTGAVMGTAPYLSPEQAAGDQVTPASDVYSLGCVAYECLTGSRPFTGDTPVAVAMAHVTKEPPLLPADVPGPLRDLVASCLAKDPGQRPASAGALGRALLAWRDGQRGAVTSVLPPTAAPPPATRPLPSTPRVTRAETPSRRRRRLGPLALALALLALAGALAWALLGRATDSTPSATRRVPDVVGKPFAEARSVVEGRDLTVVRRDTPDDSVDPGLVSAQDPPPTTSADVGAAVTLTVSTGADGVFVDPKDYIGRPVDRVAAALRGKRLSVHVEYEAGPGRAGTVTSLDPTGPLALGTTVTLTAVSAPSPTASATPTTPGPVPTPTVTVTTTPSPTESKSTGGGKENGNKERKKNKNHKKDRKDKKNQGKRSAR